MLIYSDKRRLCKANGHFGISSTIPSSTLEHGRPVHTNDAQQDQTITERCSGVNSSLQAVACRLKQLQNICCGKDVKSNGLRVPIKAPYAVS